MTINITSEYDNHTFKLNGQIFEIRLEKKDIKKIRKFFHIFTAKRRAKKILKRYNADHVVNKLNSAELIRVAVLINQMILKGMVEKS